MTDKVHILIDDNEEEILTALYMQSVMKEVGIESKICVGTDQLYWKDNSIIDNEGESVKFTWKLWTWDAIFQDYLDATNEQHSPRISEIFLHDEIKVIEPLWKAITSNKALLPVLNEMYPNHPNLLRSEWSLTEELKHIPFVKKPIAGHHGQNITMYGPEGNFVIAATTGYFSDRDCIYQELFSPKSASGYHPIINSWIIRGNYCGFGVREDENLISNNQSPIIPCCIVWEEEK